MKEILSKKEIGERFKAVRLENGHSQEDAGSILNLSRSNYSQIERGNQFPTFETMVIFSSYYGKSYEWVLHGEQEITEPDNIRHTGNIWPDSIVMPSPAINQKKGNKKILTVGKADKDRYILHSADSGYLESLAVFEIPLPGTADGNSIYRAFAVTENNDQLSLCLNENDIIIAKLISHFSGLVFNNIYIIVTQSAILIARIKDFIISSNVFICDAGNDHQKKHIIKLTDVKEIWMATGTYSTRSTPLINDLIKQVYKFDTVLTALQDEIKQLKKLLQG